MPKNDIWDDDGIVNQCSTGLHVASDVAAHLIASCIIFPHCRLKDDFTSENGKGVIIAQINLELASGLEQALPPMIP